MENSSAKPIVDNNVVFLYHRARGDVPNIMSCTANGILVGGPHRMMSDRSQIFFSGGGPPRIKDGNPANRPPYEFEVREPSATIEISVAMAWRFGIEFWRSASDAVLSLHDIPREAIWDIMRKDGNNRTARYLHAEHHYNGRIGQRFPPWDGQMQPAIRNG